MAVVGGFMGCYAILLRADFLGNAQTANLVFVLIAIFGGNIKEFLIRVIASLIYVASVIIFTIIKEFYKKTVEKIIRMWISSSK